MAGARMGNVEVLPNAFLPRFSLTLRDRPGRPKAFTGELAEERSIFLLAAVSFVLAERRSSPFVKCLVGDLTSSGCENEGINAVCAMGSNTTASMLEEGGLVKRRPGSTPLPWFIMTKLSSIGVGNEALNIAISGVVVSKPAIGSFGANARSFLAGGTRFS